MDRNYIHVLGPDSRKYTLRIEWTDLEPSPPIPEVDGRRVRLAPMQLLQVVRFLADRKHSNGIGKKIDTKDMNSNIEAGASKGLDENVQQSSKPSCQSNPTTSRRRDVDSSQLAVPAGENADSSIGKVGDDDSANEADDNSGGRR